MTDLTQHRLTMTAIWTELKLNRWRGPTSTRDLNYHGDKPNFRSVGSGTVPKAKALNAVIRQTDEQVLIGTIPADERLGTTTPTHAILTRANYTDVLARTSQADKEHLRYALHYRAGDPFAWHRGGKGEWSYIKRWDAWLVPPIYTLLSKLADHTVKQAETTETHDQHAPCKNATNSVASL